MVDSEQKQQLLTRGYVALRGAVSEPMLRRLREMADRLESTLVAAHSSGRPTPHAAVFDSPDGPVLERADKLLESETECVLDLLATRAMLAVSRELSGRGTVPIEMDLLFKRQHPNGYVIWHQGAQHSRRWPYLNVGIYLDDAPVDDGCVRYVPGSQHEKQDICALAQDHGWDIPGSVDVPVSAGDILVQDMMVLHCSLPKRAPGCRRTIYIELRPAQAIIGDDSQSPEWAALRERWMAMVMARSRQGLWPDEWRAELPETGSVAAEVAAIAERWEPPLPAHYCSHSVEHPDYPIPADLR